MKWWAKYYFLTTLAYPGLFSLMCVIKRRRSLGNKICQWRWWYGWNTMSSWPMSSVPFWSEVRNCVSMWVCACARTWSESYPVDCYLCVFFPSQTLSAPIAPLSHLSPSPALLPWFPRPPRTLCGQDCALSGRPTPKGDWVPHCTLRCPSYWPHLGH